MSKALCWAACLRKCHDLKRPLAKRGKSILPFSVLVGITERRWELGKYTLRAPAERWYRCSFLLFCYWVLSEVWGLSSVRDFGGFMIGRSRTTSKWSQWFFFCAEWRTDMSHSWNTFGITFHTLSRQNLSQWCSHHLRCYNAKLCNYISTEYLKQYVPCSHSQESGERRHETRSALNGSEKQHKARGSTTLPASVHEGQLHWTLRGEQSNTLSPQRCWMQFSRSGCLNYVCPKYQLKMAFSKLCTLLQGLLGAMLPVLSSVCNSSSSVPACLSLEPELPAL